MRKRLTLLLAVVVLAVGAIGVVGSAAWFTDTDTVPATATAGTLDIDALTPASITLSDLEPGGAGVTVPVTFWNKSSSTMEAKYRIRAVKTDGPGALWNKLNVELQGVFCGTTNPVNGAPEFDGALKDLLVESPGNAGLQYQTLPPNTSACFELTFELDETAGNGAQGATVEFDVVIDATQTGNPGWSQS